MAKRFQKWRGRVSRAYGYGKRANRGIAGISTTFMLGAVGGFMGLTASLPPQLVLGAAVAPVKLGAIKQFAQGAVMGSLVKGLTSGTSATGSEF